MAYSFVQFLYSIFKTFKEAQFRKNLKNGIPSIYKSFNTTYGLVHNDIVGSQIRSSAILLLNSKL